MSDEDPVRLKDRGSASPELVRALRALGTSSDAARLERVAQKLGATLAEGQPPMAASSAGLLGVKALVVGLVAAGIAALAWYGSSARTPAPAHRTPPSEVAAPTPPPPTAAWEPSAPVATPTAAPPSAPARLPTRHAASRSRASTAASTSASHEAASTTPAAKPNPNAAPSEPEPEPDSAHEPAPPQPTAASPAPPPPSEAALLFRARKAQPSAALHLLDQHAALYPDGLLAPEREVLRIETLRRLGRTAEADQRLRAFQARYPDSIHLRRLQKSESGEH